MRLSLRHLLKPRTDWLRSARGRHALLASGGVLFVLGLLTFLLFQTQLLFTDSALIDELQPGITPRSDGGILLGAILMGGGVALSLFGSSPRPLRDRALPALGVAGTFTALLVLHLTIFVNAFIIPDSQSAAIEASFLFHDSPDAIPVATFLLTLFTGSLILALFLSAFALLRPGAWRRHLLHPETIEAHRTRLALLGLFVLGTGASFARQFFAYALRGDRFPSGGLLDLNVAVVYYLLGFGLVLALLAFTARTVLLLWGDLRPTFSLNFRESYRTAVGAEAALWGGLFALNALLLLAGPTYQPDGRADRVFAVNSKGVSVFFLLVFALYGLHRWTGRGYLRFLRTHPYVPSGTGWGPLAKLVVTAIVLWSALALAMSFVDVAPLTRLTVRVAGLAVVLPFFAVRLHQGPLRRLVLRGSGAHYTLLAAAVLSFLAGLMLWGIGNSTETTYLEGQGFQSTTPGWTGIAKVLARIGGSVFLALPILLGLHHLGTRDGTRAHPAPFLVAGLSVVIGMNLLLTINTAAPQTATGQTDVVVGFSVVRLVGYDRLALVVIGAATAGVGYLATLLVAQRGVRRRKVGEEAEKERKKAPQRSTTQSSSG